MKLGPFLIVTGLLFGYMFFGGIVQALSNSKPAELTFEEFYTKGTSAEWLTLHDAYVDNAHRVETVVTKNGQQVGHGYTYLPVRAGPDDPRPIKLFTSSRLLDAEKSDLPGDRREITDPIAHETYTLETVRGVNLVGPKLSDEIPGILRQGPLPAAEKFLILNRDSVPPSGGEVAAMILFPLALIGLGIFLVLRARKRISAGPGAHAPAQA
ncbi:MAG: hypothetical protein HY291_03645 [Planctomycetes bacterium]|nr:hypothetical protein [Planctomycetota bacterium]